MKYLILVAGMLLSQFALSQPYLGIGLGNSDIDEVAVNDSAFTGLVYGGYKINDILSLDLSYMQTSSFNYDNDVIEGPLYLRTWTPAIHININSDDVSLFGFVGMAFWYARVGDKGITINDDEEDISFGVGIDYQPANHWALRGQWRRINMDSSIFGKVGINSYLIGLHRYFK